MSTSITPNSSTSLTPSTSNRSVESGSTVPGAQDLHASEPSTTDPDQTLDAWDEDEFEDPSFLTSDRTATIVGSIVAHLLVFLTLALIRLQIPSEEKVVLVAPAREIALEPVDLLEKLDYTDDPTEEIAIDPTSASPSAEVSAELLAPVVEVPTPQELDVFDHGQFMAAQIFKQPKAPINQTLAQRGKVGQGTQGAAGAIDRLTFEILKSMEAHPTLVVWLFDKSGSLHRQRAEIIGRFDRIYEELGIVQESDAKLKKRNESEPQLLTSIVGFGRDVQLYNEKPTNDLGEIKDIIENIEVDASGVELAFTAVEESAREFKRFRRNIGGAGPKRKVLFVLVTDERGDDHQKLESAIHECRRLGISVHVIGVPAPFGREHTFVKYVDPDPRFDQSPSWAEVDQGPETVLPERVQVGFTANFQSEPAIDSGFGPYALTRLCYETGGIYFTVHPNRNTNRNVGRREVTAFSADLRRFFDPQIMLRYRPDYVSSKDYLAMVKASPLRQALIRAAQLKPVQGIERPPTRFVKRDEAALAAALTRAQQGAAKLEPTLNRMYMTLMPGMENREAETSPRWQAGYALAMGRVLAQKIRTETYNAMLAQAKRGMPFSDPKYNTWVLEPADQISVGSRWQRDATTAKKLLDEIQSEHAGTPWAYLAAQEASVPMGWKWKEATTDLTPPRNRPNNNNNNPRPRPPRDDQARMIQKAPKRPVPKL